MIIRAKHNSGILDISTQQVFKTGNLSPYHNRKTIKITLRPGQTIEIDDYYRSSKNINNAINLGLLEVVTYSAESTFRRK